MILDESADPRPAKQQHQAAYNHGIVWTWHIINRLYQQHSSPEPTPWSGKKLSLKELDKIKLAIITEGYGR